MFDTFEIENSRYGRKNLLYGSISFINMKSRILKTLANKIQQHLQRKLLPNLIGFSQECKDDPFLIKHIIHHK